ncbi:uncharacterized protein LOC110183666 isoform X2 [Drosophila serrata]|uniref:uncharacterized protein LOC110183666 isoform X2 n=1 Tax=Drosophila serrata TaxID=7274 RepID=UPI000A1CFCB4|nr:uncharacterized protein LOC110183666 isoform X2 [Drosophila serrata]
MPPDKRSDIGRRTRAARRQMKYSKNKTLDERGKENALKRTQYAQISKPKPKTDAKSTNVVTKNTITNASTPKPKTVTEATRKVTSENTNKKISSPKSKANTKSIPKTVTLKSKDEIDSRNNDKIRCKRCDFLQRTNKNKKNCPKVCTVCLKWAHKVLQDGVEILPNRNIPNNNTTTPNSAVTTPAKENVHTNTESTISVEIEPVTDFNMIRESVTQMDVPEPSVEIEPLDETMNDEIMSDVIKEDETEIFAKTESIDIEEIPLIQEDKTEIVAKTDSIDFDEIRLIQDGLKAIDNKNTALAHVRILQEYAMLNYNFRAIGLLSEVEASIIIPEKTPNFEG